LNERIERSHAGYIQLYNLARKESKQANSQAATREPKETQLDTAKTKTKIPIKGKERNEK
jgi:hypothetical protein